MTDPTVAVHGKRTGTFLLQGLRAALPGITVVEAGTPAAASDADVLATLADDAASIADALTGRVRWVHVLGAGIDGFPIEVVGDRSLTCSRGAAAPAIAEFVLAAMLAFEKRLPESWIDEPPARWGSATLGGLEGKTLGVVGLGSIGTEVARRALAFDMEVVGLRRSARPVPLSGVTVSPDLSSLLRLSDHVVVAAPATPRTDRLFDDDALRHVKPGAHFVNVARGSLVDQDALVRALDDGRIARASLDVTDPEPLPVGHALFHHERVRLTPHISWSSPQTVQRTLDLFTENVARYRSGEELLGVVDLEEGY
ncbi:MAG: NAD(P)-dependent oxidoreductase [Acidimicrobiales bacterium]|jgi:phosphoglycerate dehydrogenase-like enzyme